MSGKGEIDVTMGCFHWVGLAFASSALFAALKLSGHLDWDWLWVLAPIWGAPIIAVAIPLLFLLGIAMIALLAALGGLAVAALALPVLGLIDWFDKR